MKIKVSVSVWVWLLLIMAILTGYVKVALLTFLALIGHESAHLLFALSYGRKIEAIKIYPFGGVIHGTEPLALFSPEEIMIAFSGPAWNLFCTALGWLLAVKTQTWQVEIKLWWQINLWMGLCNLLPLFPLDGGRILAAAAYKALGYRKGITLVSYGTQGFILMAIILMVVFRHNLADLQYLMAAVVIFTAAIKERQAAPYVLIRYLLKKNSRFSLHGCLPAKILAVQEKSFLTDIVTEMKEDFFYIICAISEDGKKRFLGEKAIIDALIEKGGKQRLEDIVENDFTV